MESRRVNRPLLDGWLEINGPDGVSRLAVQSQISASTIQKARSTGKAPKKFITLQRLSETLGCAIDELFPVAGTKGKAR